MTSAEALTLFGSPTGKGGVASQIVATLNHFPTKTYSDDFCTFYRQLAADAETWAASIGSGISQSFKQYWNAYGSELGCGEGAAYDDVLTPGPSNLTADDRLAIASLEAIKGGSYTSPQEPANKPPSHTPPPPSGEEKPLAPPGGANPIAPPLPMPPSASPGPPGQAGILDIFRPKVEDWGQLGPATDESYVLRLCKSDWGDKCEAVSPVLGPAGAIAAGCFELAEGHKNWAGYAGGKWLVPVVRGPDCEAKTVASEGGEMVKPKPGFPTSPTDSNVAIAQFNMEGVVPTLREVRSCPKGMVLAVNSLCYWKKLLPAVLRMNRSKRAPVSWSDANAIRKGNRAAMRIHRYDKRIAKNARKLAPPSRRRTAPRKPSC